MSSWRIYWKGKKWPYFVAIHWKCLWVNEEKGTWNLRWVWKMFSCVFIPAAGRSQRPICSAQRSEALPVHRRPACWVWVYPEPGALRERASSRGYPCGSGPWPAPRCSESAGAQTAPRSWAGGREDTGRRAPGSRLRLRLRAGGSLWGQARGWLQGWRGRWCPPTGPVQIPSSLQGRSRWGQRGHGGSEGAS